MEKINLKDLTLPELEEFLTANGEQKFRAKQIFKWLSLGVTDFDEMTDISKALRAKAWQNFIYQHAYYCEKACVENRQNDKISF